MGVISQNPTVSLQANIGSPLLLYLADGVAIFGCVGNPEGVIAANKRSVALSDDGNIYFKTTDTVNTGWVASGGGGGSGTVTSVGLGGNAIFDFTGSTANPIVGAGTFDIDFASQLANLVFASPNGAPGVPTFRALTSADLAAAAAPPANGVQYNDGTNAFTATNGFRFDPASNTLQLGETSVLKGTFQFFSALGVGSIKHTINNPGGNYIYIWPDTLPANNDLARFSVSGSNVTISSVAASALGFPTINATDGVIPYRSSSSAFSDSPLTRTSSILVTVSNAIYAATDGSTSAVSFGRQANTGIYFPGTNQIGFSANGSQAASISSNFFTLLSTLGLNWSSDTGLARRQAGYVRVTNGSTGIGGLLVGGSTATPIGQTHLINGAVGTIPLFVESIASTSVAAIKSENSSVQSFAFYPSGKLQGGCNIPTSNQQFSAIGNLKSDVSEIGNVGTGQDNLLSFAVPANSINNTGDTVSFTFTVVFAANANNKEVEAFFGGVSVFLVSDAFSGSQAEITVRIKRTGATTAKAIATWVSSDALLRADCQYNDISVTWSANNTFQVTGEATSNNDIINKELESNVIIAQTS